MKRFGWLFWLLIWGAVPASFAQTAALTGYCNLGATPAKTSGLSSTNNLQGIIPKCTVTVYLTGTQTLATIYSDGSNTPLANPFTATTVGQWTFWSAVNVGYDVVLSGGVSPNIYTSPVTLTGLYPGFSFSGGGGSGNVIASPQYRIFIQPNSGTQAVAQGAQTTQNAVAPQLQGQFNPDLYASGGGNNGISNLLGGSTCLTAGCFFTRGMTSTDTENFATAISAGTQEYIHGVDNTYGLNQQFYRNVGLSNQPAREAHQSVFLYNDTPSNTTVKEVGKSNYFVMATPGNYVRGSPQGSHMYSDLMWTYGRSISSLSGATINSFHVGDSFDSYHYFNFRGGEVQASDEGTKGNAIEMTEAPAPYGVVVTGGVGATTVKSNFTANNGNQGDGFYLVDTAQIMAAGLLLNNTPPTNPALNTMTTSDTHAVSTAWGTLSGNCGANLIARNAPVSTTCAITTTSGTWSAAAGATVCIGDWRNEPEQVSVTAASSTSLTMGLTFLHQTGTAIYQGGLCGGKLALGFGQTDPSSTHQMTTYWVAGSTSATTFDYVVVFKSGQNGNQGVLIPSLFSPLHLGTLTRSSNVVTGTAPAGTFIINGLAPPGASTFVISGASDSSFNGTISGQTVSRNVITYPQTGANGTATGAVLTSVGYNNYVIYCGAETVAPPPVTLNSNNQPVLDGTLNLEPNNCNWTTGDAVQQPNFYSQSMGILNSSASGFTQNPANVNTASALSLSGMAFSAANYFIFQTSDAPSSMLGYGGLILPRTGFNTGNEILGSLITMNYAPPNNGVVIGVGCPYEGCPNAYNPYKPMALSFNGGSWASTFDPRTGSMNFPNFGIGGSQQISGVQGAAGTKLAAASGTFTNGNLRSTNSTGDAVDSSIAASNVPLLNAANPFTKNQSMPSISGNGTATFTLGSSSVVGTGATTPTCTSTACDSISGVVSFTTGTGTGAGGPTITVNLPITRGLNFACIAQSQTSDVTVTSCIATGATLAITTSTLPASTPVAFTYFVPGQ